jgi:hypothetical protein
MSPGRRGGMMRGGDCCATEWMSAAIVAPFIGALHGVIAAYCLGLYVIPLYFARLLRVLQN